MNLRSIDPNTLLLLYQQSFAENGEEPGAHHAPRLDAALAYPLNLAVTGEADVAAIAAAYAIGVLRYRPFTLGNRRAAALVLELFLSLNGWRLEAARDETLNVMQQVDTAACDEAMLANWIRARL